MKKANQVVIIMTDTQRWDMVGCYGTPGMITPTLDRLAAQGMRFERGYTCCPVCGPARSAIFTGLFPHQNGSISNSIPLGDGIRTIGQRLTDHGYHSAYIGKWHLDGWDYFGNGKCPDGWDENYWYDMKMYLDEFGEEEREKTRYHKMSFDEDFSEEKTFGYRCSDKAIEFLQKHSQEDFLLVVSYDEPHHPNLCPPEYHDLYKNYEFPKSKNIWDTLEDKPEHQKLWAGNKVNSDREAVKLNRINLFACNTFVDHQIGRVTEAIEKLAPEALIIYTSDHGDHMESHCLTSKGPTMYDEITRIPFIMKWKGVISPGTVYPEPVSHADIVPTVMEAAGLTISPNMTGKSLIPLFEGIQSKVHDEIFMEFARYEVNGDGNGGFQPIRCIYDGNCKLIINLLSSDELYDHRADPEEMVNLIEDENYIEIRNSLHDRLLHWMNISRDVYRGYVWENRPWRKDKTEKRWSMDNRMRYRLQEEGEEPQRDYRTGNPVKGPEIAL